MTEHSPSGPDLPGAYLDAVRHAGGFPILLPPGEKSIGIILELVDGLIFAGGEEQ